MRRYNGSKCVNIGTVATNFDLAGRFMQRCIEEPKLREAADGKYVVHFPSGDTEVVAENRRLLRKLIHDGKDVLCVYWKEGGDGGGAAAADL